MNNEAVTTHARGSALLITVLLLALLAALSTELVTTAAVEIKRAAFAANTFQHDLAVDSVLQILPAELLQDTSQSRLDRFASHTFELTLGRCQVVCRVTDDGAKFNIRQFAQENQARQLRRKLQTLARDCNLDDSKVALRPVKQLDHESERYRWFDQVLEGARPGEIFRLDSELPVWSDWISCFGSGKVDARRADVRVLSAVLEDLDAGLARTIVRERKDPRRFNLSAILDGLDADTRQQAVARLGADLQRYAVSIDTVIGEDQRRWYVVASVRPQGTQVHYRGQVQW